ncbi:unnamed protein product [Ixodes persulcatus]
MIFLKGSRKLHSNYLRARDYVITAAHRTCTDRNEAKSEPRMHPVVFVIPEPYTERISKWLQRWWRRHETQIFLLEGYSAN